VGERAVDLNSNFFHAGLRSVKSGKATAC
jgi:hypothetical protein